MPLDSSDATSSPRNGGRDESGDSFAHEIHAAADAAAAQARTVAATASAEVRISVASAIAMASVTLVSVALLIVAWVCIVGLGVWLAVDAGWSMPAALTVAAIVNIAAAGLCRFLYSRLSRNFGFARTRKLIFG